MKKNDETVISVTHNIESSFGADLPEDVRKFAEEFFENRAMREKIQDLENELRSVRKDFNMYMLINNERVNILQKQVEALVSRADESQLRLLKDKKKKGKKKLLPAA